MDKERKKSARTLSKENKRIIMKIERYLEVRYINDVAGEEILYDIVGMARECEERGDSFAEMIGSNHEAFCQELIKNSPRQHPIERFLNMLHWILLYAAFLLPGLFLIEMFLSEYSPGTAANLIYTVNLSHILKYYIMMLVLVIGWFFVRMYSYKPTKYVFGSYFAVFMLFFLLSNALPKFIIKDPIIDFNIAIWLITFGILLLICDLLRRVIAITIAYKRNKSYK